MNQGFLVSSALRYLFLFFSDSGIQSVQTDSSYKLTGTGQLILKLEASNNS